MNFRKVSFTLLLLTEAVLLPTSMAHAADWSDPGFPIDPSGNTSCIQGAAGTTGLVGFANAYGMGDSWQWAGISGDENNFSLTVNYIENGDQLDADSFLKYAVAFREIGEPCSSSFFPFFYDWPTPPGTPPPPARFVALEECAPTVTGSAGSSSGTLTFQNLGAIFDPPLLPPDDRPEFQILTLDPAPQTSAGTYTYIISFECGQGADPESGGGSPDFDWNHYLARAEQDATSNLPNTL